MLSDANTDSGFTIDRFRANRFTLNTNVSPVHVIGGNSVVVSTIALEGNDEGGAKRHCFVLFYDGPLERPSAVAGGDHYVRLGVEALPTVLDLLVGDLSIWSVAAKRGSLLQTFLDIAPNISPSASEADTSHPEATVRNPCGGSLARQDCVERMDGYSWRQISAVVASRDESRSQSASR